MSDLIDLYHQLPKHSFERMPHGLEMLGKYHEDYVEAHDELTAQGWVFAVWDEFERWTDSRMNLIASNLPGDTWLYGGWEGDMDSNQFFPARPDNISRAWERYRIRIGAWATTYFTPEQAWLFGLEYLFLEPDWEMQWWMGVIGRSIIPYTRHRIAKCCQNALGLDNRGRPVLA